MFSGDGSGVVGDDEDISYRGARPDYSEDFTEESLPLCEDLSDPVARSLPAYSWTDWVTLSHISSLKVSKFYFR